MTYALFKDGKQVGDARPSEYVVWMDVIKKEVVYQFRIVSSGRCILALYPAYEIREVEDKAK